MNLTNRELAEINRRQPRLALLLLELEDLGVTEVSLEHRFHPTRRWRFDLALPEHMVALEFHGGRHVKRRGGGVGGAHHSGAGRARDMEKLREATALGWRCGEFEWSEVPSAALEWVKRTMRQGEGAKGDA